MGDPRKVHAVHLCDVCEKPIDCRADCPGFKRRVVCAECAARGY